MNLVTHTPRLLAACTALVVAATASAQTIAFDDASESAYGDGFQVGDNGGYGFGAWQSTVPGNQFVWFSDGIGWGTGPGVGYAFGFYGQGERTRPFASALAIGDTFTVDLANPWLPGGTYVGVSLGNTGGERFVFGFTGGGDFYTFTDASGTNNTDLSFTAGGLRLSFTLTGPDTYDFSVLRFASSTDNSPIPEATFSASGTLGGIAATAIDQFGVFIRNGNTDGGQDVFVNNLTITAIPEPASAAALLGLGALGGVARRRRRA
jgi:hypothetical protein